MLRFQDDFYDPKFVLSEKCWLPVNRDDVLKNPNLAYSAGKAIAEHSAWDFLKTKNPGFQFTTMLLPYVFEPPIQDVTISTLNATSAKMCSYFNGQGVPIPFDESILYVDVRDAAKPHIVAMTEPGLDGKRCLVIGGNASSQLIVDTLRKLRPDLAASLPKGISGSFDPAKYAKIDNRESQKYLKFEYLTLEQTLTDSVDRLLELKRDSSL